MNKKLSILSLVLTIFLLITLTVNIMAVDIGGEIKTYLSGTVDDDGNISSDFSQSLELELFLPSYGPTSSRVSFVIYNPEIIDQYGSSSRINFKNFYLRHRFNDFRLTVGRQPISWSFGSLFNPVDFSMGAEFMDQEGMAMYQDAINLRYSINWNSHLEMIAANTATDDFKWGFRARTNYQGFDLTANYVKEPGFALPFDLLAPNQGEVSNHGSMATIMPDISLAVDRLGFTFKGDLGAIGTHGALGYYNFKSAGISSLDEYLEDPLYAFVLGGDYSYTFDYNRRLIFQLEYLGFQHEILEIPEIQGIIGDVGKRLNLIMGSISYPIDDFSSVSLMTMASLDDGSFMLMPVYENEFATNLKLSIIPQFYFGDQGALFSGNSEDGRTRAGFEASLSYAF
ncbi:hypothetical protein [Natronospora cellulosivora (SeqCode)]